MHRWPEKWDLHLPRRYGTRLEKNQTPAPSPNWREGSFNYNCLETNILQRHTIICNHTTIQHGITVSQSHGWSHENSPETSLFHSFFWWKHMFCMSKDQHRITTVWLDLALNWLIGGSFTRTSNKPKPTPVITMEWENHRLCPPVLQIVATANCCKAHWARTSGSHINWIERSAGAITLPIQCHYALLYIFFAPSAVRPSSPVLNKNMTIHQSWQNHRSKPERTTAFPPARNAVLIQAENSKNSTTQQNRPLRFIVYIYICMYVCMYMSIYLFVIYVFLYSSFISWWVTDFDNSKF